MIYLFALVFVAKLLASDDSMLFYNVKTICFEQYYCDELANTMRDTEIYTPL